MTNETFSVTSVVQSSQSMPIAGTKSTAHSESGKQVPPPGQVQPEAKAERQPPKESEVKLAVEMLESHARSIGRDLHFEIDSDSGLTLIKVIDPQTEEVVRQIPTEEAVARSRSLDAADMNLLDDFV